MSGPDHFKLKYTDYYYYYYLKETLNLYLGEWKSVSLTWPPTEQEMEYWSKMTTENLRRCLTRWRVRDGKCDFMMKDHLLCLPCLVIRNQNNGSDNELREKQCIIFTNVRKLLNELTVDQTGNICKFFAPVLSESVCTVTKSSDLGEE